MNTYTTGLLTGRQFDDFLEWFDYNIGTETDVDESLDDNGNKLFAVTCHELTKNEASKCRYFEKNKLNKS